MSIGVEMNGAVEEILADAPSGQSAGCFPHVVLRVSAADAQRVQFHQFAAIVFVGLTRSVLVAIEINEHGSGGC